MKRFLILFLLLSTPVYAAQLCIDFPAGEQTRIVNGITKDGLQCNQGETLGACAKRLIVVIIKHEVKTWDNQKAQKTAIDALTPASDPNIS